MKYNHPDPKNSQHSPYKHAPIIYGAKVQYAAENDGIPSLDVDGILRVQSVARALLLYCCAVENKLLVALRKTGQQQAAVTQATNDAILQLLEYKATYPSDGINFRASDMVLAAHSNTEYLNVIKARIRSGAHIMLSEDVLVPASSASVAEDMTFLII